MKKFIEGVTRILLIIFLFYIFLVSIALMSQSFKCFGKAFSEQLIATTSNPVVALFIGLLATSIIQSSTTTTSIVVGFVAGGALSVRCAIPIVMGANIGTTVTNTIVSLGHITRKEEFGRAFTSSTMHDLFNIMTVALLFPLEMSTRFLERTATYITSFLGSSSGFEAANPVKMIIEPAVKFIYAFFTEFLKIPLKTAGYLMLVVSFMILIVSLISLANIMRKMVATRTEIIFDKILSRSGILAMCMGCLFTAIVRSSSITTSILVPLVASGVLRIETAYPIVLGANLGTTVTALIASLAGNVAATTIAVVHVLFNVTGIMIFYPFKPLRMVPVRLAQKLSGLISEKRWLAFVYVGVIFFLIPCLLIWLNNILQ